MDTVPAISSAATLGDHKMSRFQTLTFALCGLAALVDGFDVQVIGYVAPSIVRDWAIDKAALGPVFSVGLLGLVVGSLYFQC
jgi:MFS transporter, AAHS family, 4-hydroxybenzoate transporter